MWSLVALALVVSGLFVAVDLVYNQGHLIAPLDDTYIHLQYARQLGAGHFLQYNTGDPMSTGASSLLYVLILGAAWAVGFHGTLLLAFAVGFGMLCFAVTTGCVYSLGHRLVGRATGLAAGLLVALSGPLAWGVTSGMEVGLVALLTTGSVLALVTETPRRRFVVTPVVATLLALARPEGLVFAAALCGAMLWTVGVDVSRHATPWSRGLPWAGYALFPLVAGAAQLVFFRLATGSAAPNGVVAKSWLYQPVLYPTEAAAHMSDAIATLLAVLAGVSTQEYMFPGAVALVVLGLLYLALVRPEWRTLAVAVGVGLGAVVVAESTLVTLIGQHLRYVQPFFPLFLLLAVMGLRGLTLAIAARRVRRLVFAGLFGTALLFSVALLPTWGLRLGAESAVIRGNQVTIANWLRHNIPSGAPIAVNDVGATAYFSGHPIVDLIGLTSDGLAEATRNGPGALYEALRHLPGNRRPAYFSIFDSWSVHDLVDAGVLGTGPIFTFDDKSPPFSQGAVDAMCGGGPTCAVSVYRADWSLAGTGDNPTSPPPGTVRDHLNVGDLASEAAHDYRPHLANIGTQPITLVRTVDLGGGRRVVDSARHIIGGETFTASHLLPGRPVTITARIDAAQPWPDRSTGSRAVAVSVGGTPVGTWDWPGTGNGWREYTFVIPARLVTGPSLGIQIGPLQPLLGPYPDYESFGYWFSQ